jgi:hypothetical protein
MPRGFALVVTLSLMVLLTLVAVGLLSLSAVQLRASSQQVALAQARANAKLALIIAIGELQKQMGPDQRVSASGSILADVKVSHPHWTGVWDSWRAGPALANSANPDKSSEHQTIKGASNSGMSPTYVPRREDHFRSWLVSLTSDEGKKISSAQALALTGSTLPGEGTDAVKLVGTGSLGPEGAPDHVSARLLSVSSGPAQRMPGRFAWWVGDESQKARILDDTHETGGKLSLAQRIFRHQAPASTGTSTVTGLEKLQDDQQLKTLPSLRTLDVLAGASNTTSRNFHDVTPFSCQVLADVREGGLKRDLTTLLERPIALSETQDPFMLYRFDSLGQERVPIHDLAAYYQLYDSTRDPLKVKGVKYSSIPSNNLLPSGIQVASPDFGDNTTQEKYLREYTTLYRRPVPIKVQFLLGMTAVPRTPTRVNPDTHRLQLGITPSVTLWNPNNVPLVMNFGDPVYYAQMLRLSNIPFLIRWNKNNGQYVSKDGIHMTWASQGGDGAKSNIFSLYFSGERSIVFKPGEVRVFSLPYRPGNMAFNKTDYYYEPHEVAPGWDPNGFLLMPRSDRNTNTANIEAGCLTFKASDSIGFKVTAENPPTWNEIGGSGLQFFMIQTSHQNRSATGGLWHFRDYQFISRYGSATAAFNVDLISKGFPQGSSEIAAPSRSGASIISESANGGMSAFLQFALMAGCETSESANGGAFGGRKFSSRPFLHSTAMSPSFLDKSDNDSFYHYGWNWWVQDVNSVLEANVQVSKENDGYYGGGYTPETGTTHVVQQEIPVVPPMSIAALSHAHLGGFSLATEAAAPSYEGLVAPVDSFQRVSATGQAGLLPHTLQAIGNSYAHPHIPADKAFTTWSRQFSSDQSAKEKTLADHSYLANKALWDEFFFSSISPAPGGVQVFGSTAGRSARQVAEEFFFPATSADSAPLPNHRMFPFARNLDETKLAELFRLAPVFTNGLADKIAAHLMVDGSFNINSTSVEAWRVFLSSLKGKKIAFLNKDTALTAGLKLDEATPDGTPVGMASLPNGKPTQGSTADPSDADQWTNWRELSDDEIKQLATAMVKQVKLRGPFLSLSEFVNRRLDGSDKNLSVKGALQAALDDDEVSINEGFRNKSRRFSPAEISTMKPAFPEALDGPVAYGSAAYVDQADILRHCAELLTPRGDTFVIRTYGDALDANGKVEARAWCEAVIQRVPDYLDSADQPHVKQAALTSTANRNFGRKLDIVSFRWLNLNEV